MINALFIISAAGGCIFYHEYKKSGIRLDQDLVSGFLVALQNFAKETFGFEQTPQKLDLAAGVRLVYSFHKEAELLGAAVADSIDHPKLVQKLLDQILAEFVTLFKHKLDKVHETSQFSEFVNYVNLTIQSKITKRGIGSCLLGILIASILIPAILIPIIYFLERLKIDVAKNLFYLSSLLFIAGGLPQILAGYIAGNKKLAVIASLVLSLGIIPIIILGFLLGIFIEGVGTEGILIYTVFMPLILPENIALSYFGGYRREIQRLNPLQSKNSPSP
jgi:hypothetical protein